jgi:hypothetical protein
VPLGGFRLPQQLELRQNVVSRVSTLEIELVTRVQRRNSSLFDAWHGGCSA